MTDTANETWSVAGRTFNSRLIVGTGKYADYAQNAAAAEAAAAGVALGLLPGVLDTPVSYAAEAASGEEVHAHLALWHGINGALLISLGIIAVIFVLRHRGPSSRARIVSTSESGIGGAAS